MVYHPAAGAQLTTPMESRRQQDSQLPLPWGDRQEGQPPPAPRPTGPEKQPQKEAVFQDIISEPELN